METRLSVTVNLPLRPVLLIIFQCLQEVVASHNVERISTPSRYGNIAVSFLY